MENQKENNKFLKSLTIGFGIASLGIALAIFGFILTNK